MQGRNFVALIVADGRSAVLLVSVRQIRVGGSCVMAVVTFELNVGAVRSAADRLHVNRMIELDRAGIV